jgi:hypothetical protein
MSEMFEKKTWAEFRANGMLWWVNRLLHMFGWAIAVDVDDTTGEITGCSPGRVKFRGFSPEVEEAHFENVARYLRDHAAELYDEAEYPPKDKP